MEAIDAVIVRVSPGVHWHALEDDVVVGRGHALHRPDGRVFLSVDTWRDDVFVALAEAMAQDLPAPLYTVVDDDDREHLGRWSDVGFRDDRREDVYAVPTSPEATGLGDVRLPAGYRLVTADEADPDRLGELVERLRPEVPGSQGWATSPLPVPGEPPPTGLEHRRFQPLVYLIAVHQDQAPDQVQGRVRGEGRDQAEVEAGGGEYAGLARIHRAPMPRLGLVGVLPAHRRRGVARSLLAAALGSVHDRGVPRVSAEVDETNPAARALFARLGAERIGGAIELVRRS
jgi:GNAT superfamily N-acetyltransferase